ncbi:MAG: hypothetical protein M3O34_11380 [Chloroflexota bacterium]|nr:hypothetical protein [Chloroflexota bacterium]
MLRITLLPRAWEDGIAWALDAPASSVAALRRRRAIERVRAELHPIVDWRALILHSSLHGFGRAEQLAARDADAWLGLDPRAVTAAAYGLRYVEPMIGRAIDPARTLPHWLREWTTQ